MQRTVSGWRRFASFQRKPTKLREAPVAIEEEKKKKKPKEAVKKVTVSTLCFVCVPD